MTAMFLIIILFLLLAFGVMVRENRRLRSDLEKALEVETQESARLWREFVGRFTRHTVEANEGMRWKR